MRKFIRTLGLLAILSPLTLVNQGHAEQPKTGRQEMAALELKTYSWSGYATIRKKGGRVIEVRDSGTVTAPNQQFGAAAADNAFRGGAVERNRELGETVESYKVTFSGPQ